MQLVETLVRYFHTLRYLRPVQVYGRLWFRMRRPTPDMRPSPPLRQTAEKWNRCARPVSMCGPGRFEFLSTTRDAAAPGDWNRADWPKLWLYNLHYFDDLNANGAQTRREWHRELIARWIAENPPGVGNGWEPYPLSLRMVNWIKWLLAGNAGDDAMISSLAVQARWLAKRLEWHLLGNHLLANAKALVFAGCFFEDMEADTWRRKGLDILRREHAEQILQDGGHFERSPMYHAIILEDILDLIQVARCFPGIVEAATEAVWRHNAERMLGWLSTMTHPDGEIALFNDAAFDIAPNLATLMAYGLVLGASPTDSPSGQYRLLGDSGFVRADAGPALLLADVGEIGPDYLPGHAHADTLSFELSLFGHRIVVNSGTSEYGLGAERLRQRGTAAHSTLQIDDADSSEVWSGFRVARRARPVDRVLYRDGDDIVLACTHDGYARLPGKPMHTREWRLAQNGLQIADSVAGSYGRVIARFYLHPGITVYGTGVIGELELPGEHRIRWSVTGGQVRAVASTWHPRFGQTVPNQCLELQFEGPRAVMQFAW